MHLPEGSGAPGGESRELRGVGGGSWLLRPGATRVRRRARACGLAGRAERRDECTNPTDPQLWALELSVTELCELPGYFSLAYAAACAAPSEPPKKSTALPAAAAAAASTPAALASAEVGIETRAGAKPSAVASTMIGSAAAAAAAPPPLPSSLKLSLKKIKKKTF